MRAQSTFVLPVLLVAGLALNPPLTAQSGRATPAAPPAAPAPVPPAPPAAPAPPAPPAAPQSAAASAQSAPLLAARIDLLISRFQGEKRVATLPYSFNTTITHPSFGVSNVSVRLGSQVPVPGSQVPGTFRYQDVGISIGVSGVTPLPDGRYRLNVNLEDSSLLSSDATAEERRISNTNPGPVIRSNSFSSNLIVRDGQPQQFSVGTDKVSGETLKAELTLTVLK